MERSTFANENKTFHIVNRYFIYLAYDGENFHGWQIQPNGISVQECLEKALSTFLRQQIEVVGAGRTDAGVHAEVMIAHFDFSKRLDTDFVAEKLNRMLPQDISIHCVKRVREDAHARFDATQRTYKYYVTNTKNVFERRYTWRINMPLDYQKMNEAARELLHYTDFTSFSKLHTDVKTNNCDVRLAIWEQKDEHTWVFTISADRFLRNMVRAIVGTLVEVGKGKMCIDEFKKVIETKDRGKAGMSAPANALFLVDVNYPADIFIDNE